MARVLNQDVVEVVECDGCGGKVNLCRNAHGNLYYFCAAIVGEHDGKKDKCMTRQNFGRKASRDYLANLTEKKDNGKIEQPAPERKPAPAPKPAPEPERKPGLLDGLKTFITS